MTQRVENICEESIPKGNLDIIKEKAVVKIQQLTPRLLEKRSKFNKPDEGSKESIKRLKKAVSFSKLLTTIIIDFIVLLSFDRLIGIKKWLWGL